MTEVIPAPPQNYQWKPKTFPGRSVSGATCSAVAHCRPFLLHPPFNTPSSPRPAPPAPRFVRRCSVVVDSFMPRCHPNIINVFSTSVVSRSVVMEKMGMDLQDLLNNKNRIQERVTDAQIVR